MQEPHNLEDVRQGLPCSPWNASALSQQILLTLLSLWLQQAANRGLGPEAGDVRCIHQRHWMVIAPLRKLAICVDDHIIPCKGDVSHIGHHRNGSLHLPAITFPDVHAAAQHVHKRGVDNADTGSAGEDKRVCCAVGNRVVDEVYVVVICVG